MARKNQRRDAYVPLDLTPAEIPKPRSTGPYATRREESEARAEAQAARAQRQVEARIAQGIDWSVCLVPGCGEDYRKGLFRNIPDPNRRDSEMELPLCFRHMAVVYNFALPVLLRQSKFIEEIADLNEAIAERSRREKAEKQAQFMARETGDVYFVRVGDLIKVGWTRNLWSRLKSYGASAELLVSYPGTRDDETHLHRQLTPARAKGREWYEDGQVIAVFLEEALLKYGPPIAFTTLWTEPKKTVAGKRHR